MNTIHRWLKMIVLASLPWGPALAGQEMDLWKSPAFKREFMGTYGVRSDVEPAVPAAERQLMEQVMALMAQPRGSEKCRLLLLKTIKPGHSAVFDFTLGNIFFQQDKPDQAAVWYQRAIRKFPAYLRAHKNLGLVEIRAENFGPARTALTRALELGATDGLTYGLLGFACTAEDLHASAETAYRMAVMLQPDTADWKMGLARCLFKQNKFGEASALCDELVRLDAGRADYRLLKANALLGLKQPLKAAEIYEYLDLVGQATSQSLNTLGDIYVNEGVLDLAADAYVRAMAKDVEANPAKALRHAETLAARGATAPVKLLIDRTRTLWGGQLTETDQARLLKLEARLAVAAGADEESHARMLEEITRLDPLDGDALILLGQHYARTDRLEKALLYFERAAGLERYEADARLRQAQALVRNNRFQEAVPLLKRVQELRPREDVARYLEQVERLARHRSG